VHEKDHQRRADKAQPRKNPPFWEGIPPPMNHEKGKGLATKKREEGTQRDSDIFIESKDGKV